MVAQQNGTVDVQRKNIGCIVIYIKEKKKYKQKTEEKKKKVATIATVPLGIVYTVQNFKKKKKKRRDKVANQNGTVDEQ